MLLSDASATLSATAQANGSSVDNLCCGNFGRVEALIVAARRGDRDMTDAMELAGRCLTRREQDGTFSLPGHSSSFVNPTFFKGVTGVAYTLLHLRNPDALPSVLLFE